MKRLFVVLFFVVVLAMSACSHGPCNDRRGWSLLTGELGADAFCPCNDSCLTEQRCGCSAQCPCWKKPGHWKPDTSKP